MRLLPWFAVLSLAAPARAGAPVDSHVRPVRVGPAPQVSPGVVDQRGQVVVMEGDAEIVTDLGAGMYGIEDMAAITARFYQCYPDEFDAIAVFTTFPDAAQGGAAYALILDGGFAGIGHPGGEPSSNYGSPSGRLISITNMNTVDQYGSMTMDDLFFHAVMGQEFAHTWLSFVTFNDPDSGLPSSELLGRDAAHWSAVFDSGGSVMDGIDFTDNGNGTFTVAGNSNRYGPLDLYAMGVYTPEEVGELYIIRNATFVQGGATVDPINDGWSGAMQPGVMIQGTKVAFTIDDVVGALGPRTPAAGAENEDFRMAYVLVTEPGQTADEATDAINKLEVGRLAWEKMHRTWTMSRSTMCTDVSAACPLAFAEVGEVVVTEDTTADADGILEPGEDLVATATFTNEGAEDATTAVAQLTSASTAVEAPEAETLPTIAAGDSLEHAFRFRIAGDACGVEVPLEVVATIGTRTWRASTTFRPGVINRDPEPFATAAGWVANPRTTDTATQGGWEHGIPEATYFAGRTLQPDGGAGGPSDSAWFTGPFDEWDEGEVAGGATTLVSAPYDLTGYVDPILRYKVWYTAYDRPAGSLAVADEPHLLVEYSLDDGVTWGAVEEVGGEPVRWQQREVPFATGVEPGAAVRFRFTATDDQPATARLVEIGIDDIEVASLSPSCRDGGGGGCCSASAGPASSILLAIAVVLLLRRRVIAAGGARIG